VSLFRSVGRNAIFTALGRFAVLFVWFAVTPMVLGALGPDRFGFWSILLVLIVSLASLDLGLGLAVLRYTADLVARGRAVDLIVLLRRTMAVQLLFAGVLVVLGLLFREQILDAFHVTGSWRGEARAAFAFALFGFAAVMATSLFFNAFQGIQRMDLASRVTVPGAVVLFTAILFAVRAPQPLLALTIVQLAVGVVQAFVLGALLHHTLRQPHPSLEGTAGSGAPVPGDPLAAMLALGGRVQVSALFGLAQAHLDKIVLGTLVALAPVAAYEIASRAVSASLMPPILVLGALLPVVVRHQVEHGPESRLGLYRAAFPPYLVLSFALAGGLFALAPALLEAWLDHPPANAVFMLQMLSLTQAANLATGMASTMVRAGERMGLELEYGALGTVLHVGLALLGLHYFGIKGVVVGAAIGSILAALWFNGRVEHWLGGRPLVESLRAALPALASSAVAVVVALLVTRLFAAMEPGRGRGLVTSGVGAAAYAITFGAVLLLAFPTLGRSLWTRGLSLTRS
jgi:O-antigen/teichoic acid export membrane protein